MDCRAALAVTIPTPHGLPRFARNDNRIRHCEERSDVAIQAVRSHELPRFARNDEPGCKDGVIAR